MRRIRWVEFSRVRQGEGKGGGGGARGKEYGKIL